MSSHISKVLQARTRRESCYFKRDYGEVKKLEKRKTNGLWTVSFGELGATLKILQDHDVTPNDLARLRADPELAKRVAAIIHHGSNEGSTSQERARAIMGKNFWGVEEWATLYGVRFTRQQLRETAEFPWNEDILNSPCPFYMNKKIKETHFAFLGLDQMNGVPLTISKLLELTPPFQDIERFRSNNLWCADRKFIKETCRFRWYLMPFKVILETIGMNYLHAREQLPKQYEVPRAVEEATKLILYWRKNGWILNIDQEKLCEDEELLPHHVAAVGLFGEQGLGISRYEKEYGCLTVSLAAFRRLPSVE